MNGLTLPLEKDNQFKTSPIPEDQLVDVLQRTKDVNGEDPITFFEITTAAAFLAFSETKADWCLLETGLGGRLDSTNVIASPVQRLYFPLFLLIIRNFLVKPLEK